MTMTFKEYLKDRRLHAGYESQTEVSKKLKDLGRAVSPSTIAQYESGLIKDPDPVVLYLLSRLYETDYMQFVVRLMRQKFDLENVLMAIKNAEHGGGKIDNGVKLLKTLGEEKPIEHFSSELNSALWKLFEAGLQAFPKVGEVSQLQHLQIEAKAALIRGEEILDIAGLAAWERSFPDLSTIWIAATRPLDTQSSDLIGSVIANLSRGVRYTYFVPEEARGPSGDMSALNTLLASKIGSTSQIDLSKQLEVIPLKDRQIAQLGTDYVIANYHNRHRAVGFQCIRRNEEPAFGIRLDQFGLGDVIRILSALAESVYQEGKEAINLDVVFHTQFPDT